MGYSSQLTNIFQPLMPKLGPGSSQWGKNIGNVIIPTDELILFRGVGQHVGTPPSSN